ncbi:hypothetical protein VNI00_013463 [Paramarasmius palmivorus]|uniref:Uncharacterized protein n=1 Tax=Paramarasmius palmivorus TaxID=297713 RepID=A0AAW0C0U8_9AGAR
MNVEAVSLKEATRRLDNATDKLEKSAAIVINMLEPKTKTSTEIQNDTGVSTTSSPEDVQLPQTGAQRSARRGGGKAELFTLVNGKHINIEAEIQFALGQRPNQTALAPAAPSDEGQNIVRPWLKGNLKEKGKEPVRSGNGSESDNDVSTDEELDVVEDIRSDDQEESNDSRVLAVYAMIQPPKDNSVLLGRDKAFRKNERNRLVRSVILEALPARYTSEIWSLQTVPATRLRQFVADPQKYPPKVRNTWIDQTGKTTDELRASQWNQTLVHTLSLLVHDIAELCPDKTRFGKTRSAEYWLNSLQQRFDRVYVEIQKSKPTNPSEASNPILVQSRLNQENEKRLAAVTKVSSRVAKYKSRSNNASHLLEQYKNKTEPTPEDLVELEFWTYIFSVIEQLGHDGMSDEEGEDEEVMGGGLPNTRHTRKVLVLPWRHPSLQKLVQFVDEIPREEPLLFKQVGKHPAYLRERVDKQSLRKSIPKGLHDSFFHPDYVVKLTPAERLKLKIKADGLQLRELDLGDR